MRQLEITYQGLHRAGSDVLLLHELLPDADGAVGVRMAPTEDAIRLMSLGCAVDVLAGAIYKPAEEAERNEDIVMRRET